MSAHVLVTGALFRQPEQKTSKAGKTYVSATLKAKDGDSAVWWKILCFSESAGAVLLGLRDGDAVAVQGAFKAELYEKEGQQRIGFTVMADSVLSIKPLPRERKQAERVHADNAANAGGRRLDRHAGVADPILDDEIPF